MALIMEFLRSPDFVSAFNFLGGFDSLEEFSFSAPHPERTPQPYLPPPPTGRMSLEGGNQVYTGTGVAAGTRTVNHFREQVHKFASQDYIGCNSIKEAELLLRNKGINNYYNEFNQTLEETTVRAATVQPIPTVSITTGETCMQTEHNSQSVLLRNMALVIISLLVILIALMVRMRKKVVHEEDSGEEGGTRIDITTRYNPSRLHKMLFEKFDAVELEDFRMSPFGFLLRTQEQIDLEDNKAYSLITHNNLIVTILNRRISKLTYKVRDGYLNFKKSDVALFTGLATNEPPDYYFEMKEDNPTHFRRKYFPSDKEVEKCKTHKAGVLLDDILKVRDRVKTRSEGNPSLLPDLYRLNRLYALGVFLIPTGMKGLSVIHIDLVDNLQTFDCFLWGYLVFEGIKEGVESLYTELSHHFKRTPHETFHFCLHGAVILTVGLPPYSILGASPIWILTLSLFCLGG
ncbi:hypothetical protein IFM89_009228 [Coptis chinensis]|uniref:DUF1985 domain-containing protein n=1 Tax=Coptis chinensis TaxID=261450 RepID=A0A835ISJ8_9MAGN|nr:hypothetical protein IFM89_009228 [Coptis chinensis]